MTEELSFMKQFIANNSVLGAGIIAALTFGYKLIRVIKTDKKNDNLDVAERVLRDDLRAEIKDLKEEIARLKEKISMLIIEQEKSNLEKYKMKVTIDILKNNFDFCKHNRPETCPLLNHIGPTKFENLSSR